MVSIDNLNNKSEADVKALLDYVKDKIKEMEDTGEFDPDEEYYEYWALLYRTLDNELQRRLGLDKRPWES